MTDERREILSENEPSLLQRLNEMASYDPDERNAVLFFRLEQKIDQLIQSLGGIGAAIEGDTLKEKTRQLSKALAFIPTVEVQKILGCSEYVLTRACARERFELDKLTQSHLAPLQVSIKAERHRVVGKKTPRKKKKKSS